MTHFNQRRTLMTVALLSPMLYACGSLKSTSDISNLTPSSQVIVDQFAALEKSVNGRLGIAALDTANGAHIAYRAEERFPMCSTVKVLIVSAILARSVKDTVLLERRISYNQGDLDLAVYHPITEKHLAHGMTVTELCKATIQYSDNTAANLLLNILGGPAEITAFARSLGDPITRLDRIEPALNTAIPGDKRDTTSPVAMMNNLRRLLVSSPQFPAPLTSTHTALLENWMAGNTTGDKRIRSGIQAGWKVGDKTGSGDYGTNNDLAIIWSPSRAPILLAIYLTETTASAEQINNVFTESSKLVMSTLT